jgi:integrase
MDRGPLPGVLARECRSPQSAAGYLRLYETIVRIYLMPGLGGKNLTRLSVPAVQMFLNQQLEKRNSVRKVQVMKTVLSSALSRAVREELVTRNVARSTELPEWHRTPIRPWTAGEARQFLAASKTDPLYPAFVLLALCGLRRGEALGLRWNDVDLDRAVIHVRQQLQRVRGELRLGPVKTHAGNRILPLPDLAAEALKLRAEQQAADRAMLAFAWPDTDLISPPEPAGRSSPATSSARSAGSATPTRFGSSRSTT